MLSLTKIGFLLVAYQLAFIQCSCPNVKPVDNVDVDKWANGVWYDVAVTRNNYPNGEIFSSLAYNHIGDLISFNSANLPSSDRNYVKGVGQVLSNGKMAFSFGIGESSQVAEMTVVALSDDILGLFGCVNGNESSDIVWVATRVEKPEGALKTKVQNYLDTYISPFTKQHAAWMTKF